MKVMFVYGTRPEAIKMAPLILEAKGDSAFDVSVVVTGQHREMLDQVHEVFSIQPEHDLDLMKHGQSLSDIFARALTGVDAAIVRSSPDAVVVQGDTSTSTAAALAAFHRGVPIVHVEAGLRSHDLDSPFPEEANRQLTSRLAALHLAPTSTARSNLEAENVSPGQIVVTGNTVIDALRLAVAKLGTEASPRPVPSVLVTAHRRENWGLPMSEIAAAVRELAGVYGGHQFVVPMHRNPTVRETLVNALSATPNVLLCEPLGYGEMVMALNECRLVMTDSGGLQEEAPSLGKPVVVMRDTTERPEAIAAGVAVLIEPDASRLVREVRDILDTPERYNVMARATNPYGDGYAAARSMRAVSSLLGMGEMPSEFKAAVGP